MKAELKKVSWPTFKQLVNSTVAVLTICITIAVIVFVLDVIFETLNKQGVGRLKALVTQSESAEGTQEVAPEDANTVVEATTDSDPTTRVEAEYSADQNTVVDDINSVVNQINDNVNNVPEGVVEVNTVTEQ
jgi:preprotein translocase SecE subunit